MADQNVEQPVSEKNRKFLAEVWPIVKRIPAYARLALALVREPSIPRRHKILLYSAAVYTLTPIHFPVSAIPVLGQIDSPLVLLLALRDALAHCPPEKVEEYLAKYNLNAGQLQEDLDTILRLTGRMAMGVARGIGYGIGFTGRVAWIAGRRMMAAAGRYPTRDDSDSPAADPPAVAPPAEDHAVGATNVEEPPVGEPGAS